MLILFLNEYESALAVTLFLTITSTSVAFSGVVTDSILVIQSRRDPRVGA